MSRQPGRFINITGLSGTVVHVREKVGMSNGTRKLWKLKSLSNLGDTTLWPCGSVKSRRWKDGFLSQNSHYIVLDFEALLKVLNECRTSDLTYISEQTVVSVAIHDTLGGEPSFLIHKDLKELIRLFVEELKRRQKLIVENVKDVYPYPLDFAMLPCAVLDEWERWINRVPVIGFNSGKYDLNLIKRYFVEEIAKADGDTDPKIFVARKENNYMFLTTDEFKFLDIRNFLAPGMSYDVWCKSVDCKLQKLTFPYEWLTSYEKLNHVGPVNRGDFFSRLRGKTISRQEYRKFRRQFYDRKCVTMMDWLREYNLADVEPFVEAVDQTTVQYYQDKLDLLKDAVSIPGLSQKYVLNKALKRKPECELYAPVEPCIHGCNDICAKGKCDACRKVKEECKVCGKNGAYELLRMEMVGGPAIHGFHNSIVRLKTRDYSKFFTWFYSLDNYFIALITT